MLLKNKKREDRKGGKFPFKWLGPYTVHAISDNNVCYLSNKKGKVLKTKYNVSLLKPYVNVNSSRATNEQPFTELQSTSVWSSLPKEIVEKILVDTVQSSKKATETCRSISQTCSRFKSILHRKKESLLPQIYMKFPDDVSKNLPRVHDMIRVSVPKIMKIFGPFSGIATSLAEIIDDKKWKSAWLVVTPTKHSWYLIERYYWKSSPKSNSLVQKQDDMYWLKNDLYHLYIEDEKILRSPTSWLNDRIIDAAQKLICKEIGAWHDYQSVLNVQKPGAKPYRAVDNEHIQLLHDGSGHWLLTFCINGRIQICDSLKTSLSRVNRKCVYSLYKNCVEEFIVTFLPVQKQSEGFYCGPFAIAFAADILDGKSPMEARFDVAKMREHLINCLKNEVLLPFPKV